MSDSSHVSKLQKSRALSIAPGFVVLGTMFLAIAAAAGGASAQDHRDKVTICHRTNSNTKPYVVIAVDKNAAGGGNGAGDHAARHQGPVWNASMKVNHEEWGDIIPAFEWEGGSFPGLNWSGQEIVSEENCVAQRQAASLELTLDSYEPETGDDSWSNYTYTIRNTGLQDLNLSYFVIQSWYSADAVLGGGDDCGAGGHVLGPGSIAPGVSITLSFGANLEPNPQFWPQCVDRESGFVIVQVRTNDSNPLYLPGSWWVAYPVTRSN